MQEPQDFKQLLDDNIVIVEDDYNYFVWIKSNLSSLLCCVSCCRRLNLNLKRLENELW